MPSHQRSFPAIFARGGTSNGLVIHRRDLPAEEHWPAVLPAAMGSPDPIHARQLDGMGGGVSSTSKVCVIAPSARPDADVDFTFVQVGVRDGRLDLAGNCGNMSAAVAAAAADCGLAMSRRSASAGREEEDGTATVRIFNTNTRKLIHARVRVSGDPLRFCPDGAYAMDGVPGRGSRVTLSFLDPAGAKTGRALPTGRARDVLALADGSRVEASLVDVGNPGVFVRGADLGLTAKDVSPALVEADPVLKARLELIRRAGAARMGLDPDVESVPKIVLLFAGLESAAATTTTTTTTDAEAGLVHIRCLAMSMGQAHKAVPLTLALCLGAATRMPGTIAAQLTLKSQDGEAVVVGHSSGRLEVGMTVDGEGTIQSVNLHRTARILMKGEVFY